MLFSVITVTRNNLGGLKRTRASLLEQSCPDFEWIVIDGDSSDGTKAFLEENAAHFLSEKDGGIYDAMNKGACRAAGEYLLFLNAGDCLAGKDVLARLAAAIGEMPAKPDFIYGDSLEERPGGEPAYKAARSHEKAVFGMFTHHQAMVYGRSLFGGLRYDTAYKIAADYKMTLQFLRRSQSVLYLPFPVCLFESGGISQRKAALGRREQFRIRRELGAAGPFRNIAISLLQNAALMLRRLAPGLYWRLKRRSSGSSGSGLPQNRTPQARP